MKPQLTTQQDLELGWFLIVWSWCKRMAIIPPCWSEVGALLPQEGGMPSDEVGLLSKSNSGRGPTAPPPQQMGDSWQHNLESTTSSITYFYEDSFIFPWIIFIFLAIVKRISYTEFLFLYHFVYNILSLWQISPDQMNLQRNVGVFSKVVIP